MQSERPTFDLKVEAHLKRLAGGAMGWTSASDWDIVVYEKIAETLTGKGTEKLSVQKTLLKIDGKVVNGVKIYIEEGRDLSSFWRIVEEVNSQVRYKEVPSKKLSQVVKKVVSERISL